MIDLSISPFSFLTKTFGNAEPKVHDTAPVEEVGRREIVLEMFAAGFSGSACGVQMPMSLYPEYF
jgi:hypothetical protein